MAATKKDTSRREAVAAGARRRWARLPREPKRQVTAYTEDAKLLHDLVRWPEVGASPALTLRALLQASKGWLWRVGKDGKPHVTAAFYRPMQGGVQ